MEQDNEKIDAFLASLPGSVEKKEAEVKPIEPLNPETNPDEDKWDKIILPKSVYLILGDVGTGKSGLAYHLIERYSAKYDLKPCIVGFPEEKRDLLPPGWEIIGDIDQVAAYEKAFVFIDEAGIFLPLDDYKIREKVTNFLQIHRQRNQILLLGYHYPRLILARYLPFISGGYFLKRPPFLREYASKSKNDILGQMMDKAEERFAELVPPGWEPSEKELQPLEVKRHTYVTAPRLRWQGILSNPLCSFWKEDLSEVWSGKQIKSEIDGPVQSEMCSSGLMDIEGKIPITDRAIGRAIVDKEDGGIKTYYDPGQNIYWKVCPHGKNPGKCEICNVVTP